MKTIVTLFSLVFLSFANADDASKEPTENEALAQAIVASNWSWESAAGGVRAVEELRFFQGGAAENSKTWIGHWEVAGPRTLVIENTKAGAGQFGHKAYVVFDITLTHFMGFDFNGKTTVEGFRREAVDPKSEPTNTKAQ